MKLITLKDLRNHLQKYILIKNSKTTTKVYPQNIIIVSIKIN